MMKTLTSLGDRLKGQKTTKKTKMAQLTWSYKMDEEDADNILFNHVLYKAVKEFDCSDCSQDEETTCYSQFDTQPVCRPSDSSEY